MHATDKDQRAPAAAITHGFRDPSTQLRCPTQSPAVSNQMAGEGKRALAGLGGSLLAATSASREVTGIRTALEAPPQPAAFAAFSPLVQRCLRQEQQQQRGREWCPGSQQEQPQFPEAFGLSNFAPHLLSHPAAGAETSELSSSWQPGNGRRPPSQAKPVTPPCPFSLAELRQQQQQRRLPSELVQVSPPQQRLQLLHAMARRLFPMLHSNRRRRRRRRKGAGGCSKA